MKLHEYQAKRLFAARGVPVPQGDIASTPEEACGIAEKLGGDVVVKAQVLVGGRGKAGGVLPARTPAEAGETAAEILSMEIKGLPVRRVLVEERADIRRELYLGVVVDRAARRAVVMVSPQGGVEIEEVARVDPEAIKRAVVDPLLGLRSDQALALAEGVGLADRHREALCSVAGALYDAFLACDASLAEINPLVVTGTGELLAVDGKMVIDDNALFRHPDLSAMRSLDEEAPAEQEAREAGLSFVPLEGEIGCLVNGAGLAMATMDIVKHFGGAPANFLDIGGGARAERVAMALRLILLGPRVKAVLLNVFGGITRCDEVARGIVAALDVVGADAPLVVRLVGTNEAEGRAILEGSGHRLITAVSLAEAAQKAVAAARGGYGDPGRQ